MISDALNQSYAPPSEVNAVTQTLALGGMRIDIVSRAAYFLSANLRVFVQPDVETVPGDLRISIRRGPIPPVDQLGECFYDSRGIFAMYRCPDGSETIAFFNSFIHDPTKPYQIARFDPAYRTCTLTYSPAAYHVARSTGDRSREALAAFETPLDEIVCISLLARERGLMLHASATITPEGEGVLFVGHSGAGKSTLARLCAAAGWRVLSDERVIARPYATGWTIYGTPWISSARLFAAAEAPLTRLFLLHHAPHNSAIPVSGMAAIAPLLSQSCPPLWSAPGVEYTLSLLERLSDSIPCYNLGFVPDASVLDVIRDAPGTRKNG